MKTLSVEKTASKGIVMGKAFKLVKERLSPEEYSVINTETEIHKYDLAVDEVKNSLQILAANNDIFEAHLELVQDIALYNGVVEKIKTSQMNVQQALDSTITEFALLFENMDDDYFRERAADVKDIGHRLLSNLKGINDTSIEHIQEKVILVANDLAPSDTAKLNLNYILGFITEQGGVTSHVSIMAKNVGLPALVGVKELMNEVDNNDFLIMDAEAGNIIINPDQNIIDSYTELAKEYEKHQKELESVADLPAITQDGHSVTICANVGNIEDVKRAISYHIDGIGLFRSEFLYMDNTQFPTEEEQFKVYKEAAELCNGEVIIRTLDIGGDKGLSYYSFEQEENPFLGWRAIRISLDLVDMFKDQLRALLRASAYGDIKIMYPMIISVEELNKANKLLESCKKELDAKGIEYNKAIKVGMMIETPASVMIIHHFAKLVDFFSIGTNDLTQYLLAVDRGNKKIANLYNPLHPAVLQAIKTVIEAGHAAGIPVGMCGEFASESQAVKLLLGMGLDEFSVSSSEVYKVKHIIRNTSIHECRELVEKVMKTATLEEIENML